VQLRSFLRIIGLAGVVAFCTWLGLGCGVIADKGRIKIAKIADKYIARDDLNKAIRAMPSDERPTIQTQGDVLKALNDHIDRQIKQREATRLEAEGKIHVPRELAAMRFDMRHPEWSTKIAHPEDYALTATDLDYWKEERELGIDREHRKLLGEQAIIYLIGEALKDRVMSISEEEYEREYAMQKYDLKNPEEATVRGLYFPDQTPGALESAVQAMARLQTGEGIDILAREYGDTGAGVLETRIVHDPQLGVRFQTFWEKASGAEPGSVVGPVFINGWVKEEMDIQGKVVREQLPNAFFVCTVLDRKPETPKTLEEAKRDLQPGLLYAKMMARLRDQHGVEIYEDKLPDPGMYDTRSIFSKPAA
jgi:hypothetical protein